MANHASAERQLTFTLSISSPLSIPVYGMLMQVSKSVNEAVRYWEETLFEKNHVAKILSMARTTKRGQHNPLAKSYYVCTRTWNEHIMFFCHEFYIPVRNCGKHKRKRSFKDILGDYIVYTQSIDENQKKGFIRVMLRNSFKNSKLENKL